jgi:hypothetical protein
MTKISHINLLFLILLFLFCVQMSLSKSTEDHENNSEQCEIFSDDKIETLINIRLGQSEVKKEKHFLIIFTSN